jgi:hypothetical protein
MRACITHQQVIGRVCIPACMRRHATDMVAASHAYVLRSSSGMCGQQARVLHALVGQSMGPPAHSRRQHAVVGDR